MTSVVIGAGLFLAAGISAVFPGWKHKAAAFIASAAIAQCFLLPAAIGVLVSGGRIETAIVLNEPIGRSFLRLDALSALFVVIISLGGLLAAVYSHGYMRMYRERAAALSSYYVFLGLLIASMLFVVIAQNALLFIIAWELMSISSFFLVSFENWKTEARRAGIYYFTAMQIGAAFLFAAFSWTSAQSGSLDFESFAAVLGSGSGEATLLLTLFFLGFGTKAGFFPLHTWLPRAHPAAPTGVSAIMSGVMIKTGIYGILRVLLIAGPADARLAYAVFFVSTFTGIFGVMNAIAQHDLKKLLAYHSMENIGIIGMGIGLGMLGSTYGISRLAVFGYMGAMLHVFNHFVFKSILFHGAGIVYMKTRTRNIDSLGGLMRLLPAASTLFLIASLAICGMPLFNGFISEFSIYTGLASGFSPGNLGMNVVSIFGMSGLAFIGIMAVLCFTKVVGVCFLGSPRGGPPPDRNGGSAAALLPMYILTACVFVIGLFPQYTVRLLESAVSLFLPASRAAEFQAALPAYSTLSNIFLLFILAALLLWGIRLLLLRKRPVREFRTWDCGYQGTSGRLQYTGSSYAQPFLTLVRELVPQSVRSDRVEERFPKEAHLESHALDVSERYFIRPALLYFRRFMNLFAGIQSGRLQQYIAYGLVFLILILLWIFGVD